MSRLARTTSAVEKEKLRLAVWFLAPSALLVAVFVGYPLVENIVISFTDWNGLAPVRTFVGLENYVRLFTDSILGRALLNNVLWLIAYTAGAVGLGLFIAVLINVGSRGSGTYRTLFFLPQILGGVIFAVIWKQVFAPGYGPITAVGEALGIPFLQRALLGLPETVNAVLLLAAIWGSFGFYAVILIAGLQNVDRELIEAGLLDGANALQRFWHITLPQISNSLNIAIVLALIGGVQVFDVVFVMTGGGPANASEVIATYAYSRAFTQFQAGYGAALTVVMSILSIGISLAYIAIRERRADAR